MEAHYRRHLAYHCADCGFSCSNKAVLLRHRRLGHAGPQALRCDFCAFFTFNPVEFERHVGRLHAGEKIHCCSQCSYVTAHRRGLKRHVLTHGGEKPFKCSQCEFRCRDESYLSKHMLVHADHKNFMCAECGYVTKWKHYLTVHMRKHAGDLRYSCDQCSYRCHRMDQLKSHKLRHQAKSLMCEICAYACKRKYELRNHMLAKHSGGEKKSAAYKCKYCPYTTWYRQALQNHENCKHTKLKEFHCALCVYSSYSGISLFLHKRKVHGYVPGDAAWLENYAAKEKERNSGGFVEDFYRKSEESTSGTQSGTNQCAEGSAAEDPVFTFVSQDVGQEAVSEGSVASPEQYCTLVLTALTTAEEQTAALQNEDENRQPTPALTALHPSTPTSSLEEDAEEVPAGLCEPSDGEDASQRPTNRSQAVESMDGRIPTHEGGEIITTTERPTNPSQAVESVGGQTLTPEGGEIIAKTGSSFSTEETCPSHTEVRLKSLRKHDQDQAEVMILEGRVQMLAVPSEAVYRCDKCSYATSKETALDHHSRALCHSRTKGHECKSRMQRRGLNRHLKKQHTTLPRNARTSVGSSVRLTSPRESRRGQKGTSSEQKELQPSEQEHQQQKAKQVHQEKEIQTVLKDVSTKRSKLAQNKTLYVKKDGQFQCKGCGFSSVKLPTVIKHLKTCRETFSQIFSEMDKDGNQNVQSMENHADEPEEGPSGKPQRSECSNDAVDNHEKCPLCSFSAKSKRTLSRHILSDHKDAKNKQHISGKQQHRCSHCSFSTSRRYRLEEHESCHTGVGRHACDVCDKTFGAAAKLRQHKLRVHDKRPTDFCTLCDFAGYAPDDVRRHKRRCHSGEPRHVCGHCDARFSSEIALRNHCRRLHQVQVCFPCKKCDFTCSSEGTLKQHQESGHPEARCPTCQEVFQTKESLDIHQRTHLAHPCQLCPFAAKTSRLLAQHLLGEHEEGSSEDKPLRCGACEFACRHQLVLEQHLRSHGSKRMYKCTDCEYATRNKQKITWHIRIHTGEKPYSCERCSYTCSDPSRLKMHMRVHQEEKKYLCPECGYKCKWASQLKYHMTKHTGEKPYACVECEYRTNRADALRAHRDTQHCDVRRYVCETCGKAFKTSFILKTHLKKHTEERAYACGRCHKTFRWPAGLRHHFLSHTERRPFSCRRCPYRAKQRFQVVKHLQRHHPEEPVERGVVRDTEGGVFTLKEALQGAPQEEDPPTSEEGGVWS